ncbi:hypothetical protein TNCV_2218971 [Trichonephila clavipes]|nr:hypothetical protein TNCV_2218971 [Trichonephila clavipes]
MNKPTSSPKRLQRCIHIVYRFLLEMPRDLLGIKIVKKENLTLNSWLMVNLSLVSFMAIDVAQLSVLARVFIASRKAVGHTVSVTDLVLGVCRDTDALNTSVSIGLQVLSPIPHTNHRPLSKTWRGVRPSNMMPAYTIEPPLA